MKNLKKIKEKIIKKQQNKIEEEMEQKTFNSSLIEEIEKTLGSIEQKEQ